MAHADIVSALQEGLSIRAGQLGNRVSSATGQVTVGTVSTVILDANTERLCYLIQNQSANDIYVNFAGTTATTDSNCFKMASGDVFGGSGDEKINTAITAISSIASSIYVKEIESV